MKDFVRILGYTLWWGVAGLVVGWGLATLFAVDWLLSCMLLNIIAGLLMLLPIFRNPRLERLFMEGPEKNRPGSILIGLLWSLPFVMICAGLIWRLMGQLSK